MNYYNIRIITQIATKWCQYSDRFVERILMKLTLVFSKNDGSSSLVLSFDSYLQHILKCFSESTSQEIRIDSVMVVVNMAKNPSLLKV